MKIDWSNWGTVLPKKVSRVRKFLRSIFRNTNVPLHMSNHYVREHFVDDKQGKLF